MNSINFEFSDTIAGYITGFERESDIFTLHTSDRREYAVKFSANAYAWIINNLNEPRTWCRDQMRDMLEIGRYVFVYGVFYPEQESYAIEAQYLIFSGPECNQYLFEEQDWWIRQIQALGEFYIEAQFDDQEINYAEFRTAITLDGDKAEEHYRQETDTVSRLVYGFASAYMLTGDERFLDAAEKGTEYLRKHMRFVDQDRGITYWYHGIDIKDGQESKIFTSEFGDDYNAIPAYEQIYALTGPVQTYRLNGDPRILEDARRTMELFERFYLDKEKGGYFSHLDPVNLDPRHPSLGENRAKKNWNSIGDHAPAYLINLYLATGDECYGKMLEYVFDSITEHFQDYQNSPFVQEKFFEDWSHDQTYMWQQNRGVVGHNLKIAWNLMRMFGELPKKEYKQFTLKIAEIMPTVGYDLQRGGWYDVMERERRQGEQCHRMGFHDRKAWWQQEQGILAYLLLHGISGEEKFLRLARESAAFYNAFFLDHDDGGVYFNVLASGIPYLLGTERFKGSHSMSGYHSFELTYLAQVYINLLITKKPLTLYFKPLPGGFADNLLHVAPDILPKGSIRIAQVWIKNKVYKNFDAKNLSITLPESRERVTVKVQIESTGRR